MHGCISKEIFMYAFQQYVKGVIGRGGETRGVCAIGGSQRWRGVSKGINDAPP
jgi:hypothetical protein